MEEKLTVSEKKKKGYLELLRVMACFFVIVNHTSILEIYARTPGEMNWIILCAYFFLSKVAVPLFIMISGTLLLGKVDGYRKCGKRVARIVCVLILFSFIYYVRNWYFLGDEKFGLITFLGCVMRQHITNAYWYLYTYLGILVMLPLLQRLSVNLKKRDYWYLFLITIVFFGTMPIINHYVPEIGYEWLFGQPLFSPYIGMFFLGYYLENYVEVKGSYAAIGGLLIVVCVTFQVIATYFEALETPEWYMFFDDRTYLPITLSSAAVFYIAKWLETLHFPEWFWKAMSALGGMTFGIYLLVDLFLQPYYEVIFTSLAAYIHRMPALLVYEIAIFLTCLLITWILKKIPYLKKLL